MEVGVILQEVGHEENQTGGGGGLGCRGET